MTNGGGSDGANPTSFSTAPGLSSIARRSSYASVVSGSAPYHMPARNVSGSQNIISTPSNSYPPISYPPDPRHQRSNPAFGVDANSAGAMHVQGQRSTHLPPYSRQFALLPAYSTGRSSSASMVTPTYLRHSRYMSKLQAAHKRKHATQKESSSTSLSTSSSSVSLQRPVPSHRGMTFEVIENPPAKEDHSLPPLPTRWNEADKYIGLDLLQDGREIRYAGPTSKIEQHEAAAVRADHRMPHQGGIYYFEVEIIAKSKEGMVAVGFSGPKASLERLPGWESDSWAYHGDDGKSFYGESTGRNYGPTFGAHDIIGCGVNFTTGCAFFTKNGVDLGIAFRDLKNLRVFPSVGMKRHAGATIKVNFGQTPFIFDIDGLVARERNKLEKEINSTKASKLRPGLDESSLIQELVGQYLAHDGYVETAKAFTEEVHAESRALQSNRSNPAKSRVTEEDIEATNRQRIRASILDGDIDKALKHTNAFYPRVLDENPHIVFRLKLQKYFELIRKTIDLQNPEPAKSSTATNGHGNHAESDVFESTMELDEANDGEEWDKMETEEATSSLRYHEMIQEAMNYGQMLTREYRDDSAKKKFLDEAFSLLAYDDAKSSIHGHLLESSGRVPVAEELNSAILVSLGKSSSAALERLYQQVEALVNEVGEDGGPGTLINVANDFLP